MACPTGIEPVTPSLEGWCSIRLSYGHHSNRILPPHYHEWSGWRDLNSRHPGPKPGALPGYATPRKADNTFPVMKGQFDLLLLPVTARHDIGFAGPHVRGNRSSKTPLTDFATYSAQ